jgi:hypothetical protein
LPVAMTCPTSDCCPTDDGLPAINGFQVFICRSFLCEVECSSRHATLPGFLSDQAPPMSLPRGG